MLTNKIYNNFAGIDKDQTNIHQGPCMAMQVSVVFLFIPFYFFVILFIFLDSCSRGKMVNADFILL